MRKRAYEQLRPHLLPGERLLWCGRPAKGFRIDGEIVAISVILLVVTTFWLITATAAIVEGGTRWPPAVIMTVVGVLFWHAAVADKMALRRAAYGVTDRRVIIADTLLGRGEKSIPYRNLCGVMLRGTRSFGTICCSRSAMTWKKQNAPRGAAHPGLFRRISDAGAVYDLITEQRARALGLEIPAPGRDGKDVLNRAESKP